MYFNLLSFTFITSVSKKPQDGRRGMTDDKLVEQGRGSFTVDYVYFMKHVFTPHFLCPETKGNSKSTGFMEDIEYQPNKKETGKLTKKIYRCLIYMHALLLNCRPHLFVKKWKRQLRMWVKKMIH